MNRIQWTRGMRLTDEILRLSDSCHDETMAQTLLLAAAGRFGLMPATVPFRCHLNPSQDAFDVDELQCLAVTRGGNIIDICYDPSYNCPYQTRVPIPAGSWPEGLLLTVCAADEWIPTAGNTLLRRPQYYFTAIAANAPVPDNSLPIAHIVYNPDRDAWEEVITFVPPCLFVASHPGYENLREEFSKRLASIDEKTRKGAEKGNASLAIAAFWPLIQQLHIAVDMGRDLMTPAQLLSYVQRCVSAYLCACAIAGIKVERKDMSQFISHAYDYKDVFQRIDAGIKYCKEIEENLDNLAAEPQPQQYYPQEPQPQPQSRRLMTPVLGEDQMMQVCTSPETKIDISYPIPTATIFFTIDGSNPTPRSKRATREGTKTIVIFDNGYTQKEYGPDKTITLKLMAMLDGVTSSIGSYDLQMHKSENFKEVIPI